MASSKDSAAPRGQKASRPSGPSTHSSWWLDVATRKTSLFERKWVSFGLSGYPKATAGETPPAEWPAEFNPPGAVVGVRKPPSLADSLSTVCLRLWPLCHFLLQSAVRSQGARGELGRRARGFLDEMEPLKSWAAPRFSAASPPKIPQILRAFVGVGAGGFIKFLSLHVRFVLKAVERSA